MIAKHFENIVLEKFGFDFSPTQQQAMDCFLSFFFSREEENLFLLKGFAGTGKTSLVAAVVNTLLQLKCQVVLLAPTGRAAKVFSSYSGQPAFTIHKKIYRQKSAQEGIGYFNLGFNPNANTLFFVDEASMISTASSDSNFGSGSLLDDLFEYVYNGRNNRLVLIGDTAQLPPIGSTVSPALEAELLSRQYGVNVYEARLTDIMRQSEASGILYNATRVREMIDAAGKSFLLKVDEFPDVTRISGGNLLEELDSCYGRYGVDETMVICRSNKRANRFNEGIRARILYREEAFTGGDKIMIVKNNYFWGAEYDHVDFIANGDIATVERIGKHKELYGFHFAEARLSIYGYEEEITAWVMLDTLTSEQPALSYEEYKRLYAAIEEDYMNDIPSKQKRFKKIRENEFFNALQIKFAYAVTGHKAQGGQWDAVFVDPGWITDELPDDEYWRWLYTAITRARQKVFLINFRDDWFETRG
ncbi:ATP-dependent DNA helicase [Gabonibacter chumensis]|uniref:ATP-dependent DNA helicase n=1 Tax=Gabonibacter chumensis TaxID=2972474 RepID=UPI002572CE86|nr:AAA family ATPase [Gabonibacter chumensis]MCR9011617.1 AAA family ATPase [Gabonibacter chumensis]